MQGSMGWEGGSGERRGGGPIEDAQSAARAAEEGDACAGRGGAQVRCRLPTCKRIGRQVTVPTAGRASHQLVHHQCNHLLHTSSLQAHAHTHTQNYTRPVSTVAFRTHQPPHRCAPPIIMPIAPSVGQSWIFFSQKRSSRMVKSRVKRRRAMNMGTLRPAVPEGWAQPCEGRGRLVMQQRGCKHAAKLGAV